MLVKRGMIYMPEMTVAKVKDFIENVGKLKRYCTEDKPKDLKADGIEDKGGKKVIYIKTPKAPHHLRRCRMFMEIINKFNDCLVNFEATEASKCVDQMKTFYEDGRSANDTIEFLDIAISKEINSFRAVKEKLNKEITDAKAKIENVKSNINQASTRAKKNELKGKLKEAEQSLKELEKFLKRYKFIRKRAKANALNCGVATESTFLHTICNFKNEKDLTTYNGMAGTILKVDNFITKKANNEEWKHTSTSELKSILNDMQKNKKGFYDSNKTFNKIMNEYRRIQKEKAAAGSLAPAAPAAAAAAAPVPAAAAMKDEDLNLLKAGLKKLVRENNEELIKKIGNKEIKSTGGVKKWSENFGKKIDEVYNNFVAKSGYANNPEVCERLNAFKDVYCCVIGGIGSLDVKNMEKRIDDLHFVSLIDIFSTAGLGVICSIGGILFATAGVCPAAAVMCCAAAVGVLVGSLGALTAYLIRLKMLKKSQLNRFADYVEAEKKLESYSKKEKVGEDEVVADSE